MLQLHNPATGELLCEVETDTPDSVARAVDRARCAQPAWAALSLETRAARLKRFGELLARDTDALAEELATQTGKPVSQGRSEIAGVAERLDFFITHAPAALAPEMWREAAQSGETGEALRFEALGVVANISAWNYPFFVGVNVFIPALLTGNCVLYKPSELCPLTGRSIARLLHEAGVPEEVFIPLIGAGEVGAALLEQDIDAVCFTGSYATGRKVAQRAAERLISRVQLELGGKDPAYVCEDADPQRAAEALADGAFYNAGQSCCAVERIYLRAEIADAFMAHFLEAVRALRSGDPLDQATTLGPLARAPQRDLLEAQVKDALARGAQLQLGGARQPGPGYYFAPSVLTHCNAEMALMREESFGPLIGLQVVQDDDEALTLMNDTRYGLTAGVFTPDRARAEALLARCDAGSVYWNCCDRVSPRLPWSGRKHSGLGNTCGTSGIRTFLKPKAYHLRLP